MKVPTIPRDEPERPEGIPKTEEHRFPCDNCGGDMRFDPGDDRMTCDHCGNTMPLPRARAPIREIAIDEGLTGAGAEQEETRVLDCPNCGAQVEFDPDVHAAECPFCATPVVTGTGINRHIKPAAVIPFALEEKQAHDAMNDWLGSLWFAPNGLQQYARKGRKLSGVYVPFWTFDAQTETRYAGQRGDTYFVTRTVMRDGKPVQVQVPKVRWSPRRGRVARFFDDVVILASRSLPKTHTDALEPWDMADLAPYAPQYLAGFRAEAYQMELRDGLTEARARMDAVIARDVRMDIGGDQQRITSLDTRISDVTFKHVLLPVWIAAYKYRGDTFRFVVNGQTGRVRGERPYSAWKIALAVIAGLILAAIVGFIASQSG
ncbi:TFIIB-type zinc finger domain-containing protein [Jannaschia sp. S6380]|uniref:TFIIB-type zinc finger domain-containing protein n=1 Tax=Jannaschia sp. S6380 TaxID=2926408 RepID=UPI001FF41830|nr:TFIIB-type zinc finger domain-containing protein [Jannaschia sp. S6380]MCK0165985.1 TFIIB-type zinc finger domain-containing protein [Jannaschia sp. S6380]